MRDLLNQHGAEPANQNSQLFVVEAKTVGVTVRNLQNSTQVPVKVEHRKAEGALRAECAFSEFLLRAELEGLCLAVAFVDRFFSLHYFVEYPAAGDRSNLNAVLRLGVEYARECVQEPQVAYF